MLNNHPFKHWVPPKMPPRFSLNTDLTIGVNAPLLKHGFKWSILLYIFVSFFSLKKCLSYHQQSKMLFLLQ
jgi:hypothetical protein